MTPATKSHFLRLIRALRAVMQDAQLGTDVVVGSALARWCKESYPGLPRSGLQANAQLRNDPAVAAFVDFVKSKDLLEATYWLSSAYAQLAGEERRKQLAMFFTPPSLTRRLLDDLSASGVDFAVRKFCDPACGGAAFLAPIAMRMRDMLRERGASAAQILDHVQRHLLGFDKDAALCEMSKHFLLMVLHDEVVATGERPKFQVHHGDSLLRAQRLLGTLDVVVCNPPFRKMPSAEVAHYLENFADIIEAQPNLYALFVALCVKLLAPGGTCALVTPTSFLSGQYFSKLRTFLLTQANVLSIGMVSDRLGVFIDVEQETALTLARREQAGHVPVTEADVSVVARDGHYVNVGRCVLPNSGTAWPIPRTESDVVLLKSAAKSRATLADYGYTPRIGAFVWNRDTRTTYPSAKSAAHARGGTAVPLLWSSDISPDGCLRFSGAPKANREHCFVNLGAKDHRSVVRRPSVLLQRVTSNDQPRRLVAAAVPRPLIETYGGFVGENHTVILEQVSLEPALTPEELAQLLATPTVDRYFRCISGVTNVSVFELSQLRLPDPGRLRGFLARGYDMPSAARKALQEQ
ncbi:N-6 DNA methylase [Burkholderia sp. A9]|uniref:HsdM family class I SAM-dependent methyltransferase n=1 Tax=Burkholderia sp. A9 TaxID=1365108 RepID=UPI0005746E21|nr:N-6 DNA methylase [Burkholderia sp. A9]KHK59961.1 N-6 DNA methylase [Burkholderia sp. A9]